MVIFEVRIDDFRGSGHWAVSDSPGQASAAAMTDRNSWRTVWRRTAVPLGSSSFSRARNQSWILSSLTEPAFPLPRCPLADGAKEDCECDRLPSNQHQHDPQTSSV